MSQQFITDEQAGQLRDSADQHGAEYRDDYSGRFMYGARCIGLTGTIHAIMATVAEAGMADPELGWLLVRNDSATDSMGLDMIVYWPDLAEEGR